jgi:hypothetical protein
MNKKLTTKQDAYGYTVYYEGGGQVPKELSGRYTSKTLAEAAIATYIPKKRVRKIKDADSQD